MIAIRPEQPDDILAIRDVNRQAFGQDDEADIVDALRANGAAALSLVAVDEDRVVGHIMYSPLAIAGRAPGAALGPMAVLPAYQRRGIGTRLVEAGTSALVEARCPYVIVLGHPGFYPRFGFRPAADLGITCEWDVPREAFMVLVLDAGASAELSGLARYRHEFTSVPPAAL